MKLKNIILSTALLVGFCACDDLFEPAIENHKTVEDLENMPAWAVGLLGHAYISNPLGENANSWKFTDVATDDVQRCGQWISENGDRCMACRQQSCG